MFLVFPLGVAPPAANFGDVLEAVGVKSTFSSSVRAANGASERFDFRILDLIIEAFRC